jgi:hypothetical protein
MDSHNRIGLNFIRPDVNRPGNFDFVNSGVWLVDQYKLLGVKWNRLAFSWVLIEPEQGVFNWEPYDQIVAACEAAGIEILATLGGHFDRPPVPAWAGESLKQIIRDHPEYLDAFITAWVRRYAGKIQHWEMLNEPHVHHKEMTVLDYVEGILKPGYRIVKSIDPQMKVLPCAYNQLPMSGNAEDFWDASRGYYDIHNLHIYADWAMFRSQTHADLEVEEAVNFRALMEKHGEGDKAFWVTETGWWGTCSLAPGMYDVYKKIPALWIDLKPVYAGKEILAHPVVQREDEKRAVWMNDLFPRLLNVAGCDKVFLWVALDEFENGYDPDRLYGQNTGGQPGDQVDLWGIIAGDKTWRKSAYSLQEIMRQA